MESTGSYLTMPEIAQIRSLGFHPNSKLRFNDAEMIAAVKSLNLEVHIHHFIENGGKYMVELSGSPLPQLDSNLRLSFEAQAEYLSDAIARCLAAVMIATGALRISQKTGSVDVKL